MMHAGTADPWGGRDEVLVTALAGEIDLSAQLSRLLQLADMEDHFSVLRIPPRVADDDSPSAQPTRDEPDGHTRTMCHQGRRQGGSDPSDRSVEVQALSPMG